VSDTIPDVDDGEDDQDDELTAEGDSSPNNAA
jgi:hypothetical protein